MQKLQKNHKNIKMSPNKKIPEWFYLFNEDVVIQ